MHLLAPFELFPQVVIGYYALTVLEISKADLPELLKKMPQSVPVIKLGRLAIDLQFQGQGHGKDILADALLRAGSQVAGVGLVVDALNPDVAVFYRKLGFFQFQSDPMKLFYPLVKLCISMAELSLQFLVRTKWLADAA